MLLLNDPGIKAGVELIGLLVVIGLSINLINLVIDFIFSKKIKK